ncbi:MAG: exodeoxyribonuclease VII small subunit [Armatimonadota bacterium]
MSQGTDDKAIEQLSFEEALNRLEELVEQMDAGDLQLEEAIEKFELAMRLQKHCHTRLSEAEATIEKLLEESDPGSDGDVGA